MKAIVKVELNRDELNALQYPIVVEMWDTVSGCGSKRRKYHSEFTEEERECIAHYHAVFRRWHLTLGTPSLYNFDIENLLLIKRAIHFFATV